MSNLHIMLGGNGNGVDLGNEREAKASLATGIVVGGFIGFAIGAAFVSHKTQKRQLEDEKFRQECDEKNRQNRRFLNIDQQLSKLSNNMRYQDDRFETKLEIITNLIKDLSVNKNDEGAKS